MNPQMSNIYCAFAKELIRLKAAHTLGLYIYLCRCFAKPHNEPPALRLFALYFSPSSLCFEIYLPILERHVLRNPKARWKWRGEDMKNYLFTAGKSHNK